MFPSDKTVYRFFLLKKIVYPEQYRIKWKKLSTIEFLLRRAIQLNLGFGSSKSPSREGGGFWAASADVLQTRD